MQLFVRFNNSTIPVTVNSSSTVQEIRSHISSRNNLTNAQVRIVFAGKELLDHQSLKDVDILSNTVVHAFRGTHLEARSAISNPVSRPVTSTKGKQSVPTYYVLCKRECKSVQPGKLRVRCVGCGEDNMILRTEPQGWSDVLQKGRVSGICHTQGCPGAKPEFYFKCRGHMNHHDYVVPLPLIKTNFLNVPCMTCLDEESDPLLVFPCSASHVMCLSCFKSYCIAQLNNRQFIEHDEAGYTVTCPGYDDPSCRNAVINDVHHFGVMGDDNYERYKQFGAEECVLKMGGVLCPGNDCGMGIFLEDETETHVQCSECMLDFCVRCKGEAHGDEGCDAQLAHSVSAESTSRTLSMFAVNVALSRWDKDSADTIRKTTKPCPNCGTPIEKSGGCMHMECPLARCAFSWCWICGGEWTPECQDNHWFG